ncbi:MAG: dipeptide epimerase [Rhodobacteraceae bacterium]|nr:dipeptide epimerase [Paracoccaceae bacterium]
MKLSIKFRTYPLKQPFSISRGTRSKAEVIEVRITRNGVTGRGECVPYARYGESPSGVCEQLYGVKLPVSRDSLQLALPPGAARNALDCALWDLEAKTRNVPVWRLARLPAPKSIDTAYTLSLDTPRAMHEDAHANRHRPLLKVKLGDAGDLNRLHAVRSAAPTSKLIVDANEGWTAQEMPEIMHELAAANVSLVEQPLPVGNDEALVGIPHLIPICADESCHDRKSLPQLKGRYEFINIKLDKTGGLTEALKLLEAAKEHGFGIMIGCMIGSSLGIAPATLLGHSAQYVDLDPPLLLASDQRHAISYKDSRIDPPQPELWG